MRRCVKCKVEKPATSEFFYKDKNRALGLMYRCKECNIARMDNFTHEEMKVLGLAIKQIKDSRVVAI